MAHWIVRVAKRKRASEKERYRKKNEDKHWTLTDPFRALS